MLSQNERLANALQAAKAVQNGGIIRSRNLSRTHRERLVDAHFLQEVLNGWLILTHPEQPVGSTVVWYGLFWTFIEQYLSDRFGDSYCLSAEASIERHVRSTVVPSQVAVIVQEKVFQTINLPCETSICVYSIKGPLPPNRIKVDGIWLMDLPTAIVRLPAVFYANNPQQAEIALRMVGSASELLHVLLEGSNTVVAGRLIGALTFIKDDAKANEIKRAMVLAGGKLRIANPFARTEPMLTDDLRMTSPYVARIRALWAATRSDVLEVFADYPTRQITPPSYLAEMERRYEADAYNSLSIEGYRVTQELIDRVRREGWDLDPMLTDNEERNALAARGYYQAFKAVKRSIDRILYGADPTRVIEEEHQEWYRQMFLPAVTAGILKATYLAGYRNGPVYIQGSRHVPPQSSAIVDCMEALMAQLRKETHPVVRAVLGHFAFVFIHPYSDGNGRIGRFLMNTALAPGGYPWTVIRQDRRDRYMAALETASTESDLKPFATFVREEMETKLTQ